jgi:hypothetical protein
MEFQIAKALAVDHMLRHSAKPENVMIADEHTIETADSWIFFWNSKGWLLDRDPFKRLMGNLPILVDKHSGQVRSVLRTGGSIEKRIALVEEQLRSG